MITGTNIKFGFTDVNTSGNVGRLLVDTDKDLAGVTRQPLRRDGTQIILEAIEADFTDLLTNDSFVIDLTGRCNFTKDS